MEDLLYEAESARWFMGLKLSEAWPDETTIVNFRHLWENHGLGQGLLEEINARLDSQGLRSREGSIVDADIIEVPSSTKNRARERDPEMHQTKKGNQWHSGMKAQVRAKSLPSILIGGGASVPAVEVSVWTRQGALPWAGQEHATLGVAVRTGQPTDGGGTNEGVLRPAAFPDRSPACAQLPETLPWTKFQSTKSGRQRRGCRTHSPSPFR